MSFKKRFRKKFKKFIKSPRLFFVDALKKPMKMDSFDTSTKQGGSIEPDGFRQVKFSDLKEDNITECCLYDQVFKVIDDLGVNFYIIPLKYKHVIRIAIPDNTVNVVLESLNDIEWGEKQLITYRQDKKFGLISLYFHDDDYVFKSRIIQLDPWYISTQGILTRNFNDICQFIPISEISKSVYSYMPFRLKRDKFPSNILDHLGSIKPLIGEFSLPIDIVYTWVDSNDPKWIAKKKKHSETSSTFDPRFVEYDQLRYSLRSLFSYCKFIRTIYLVTDSHVPYWLDTDDERIKVIDHKEIFDNQECLPVFNSVAIESNLHKIDGLSEAFIYMNDDVFFGSPVCKGDFIFPNGVGKLFLEDVPNAIGEIFDDYEDTKKLSLYTVKTFREKYGSSPNFWPLHAPMIKFRSVMEEINCVFEDVMERTSSSRFRSNDTVSPMYLLHSFLAYYKGKLLESKIANRYLSTDALDFNSKIRQIRDDVKKGRVKTFCINDHRSVDGMSIKKVQETLDELFPVACPWELDRED